MRLSFYIISNSTREFQYKKYIINEYGIINDQSAAQRYITIIIIITLKSQNLVDGIGIQCHQFNVNTVSTSTAKVVLDHLVNT
jgi:endo-1,4-beta-xylanase